MCGWLTAEQELLCTVLDKMDMKSCTFHARLLIASYFDSLDLVFWFTFYSDVLILLVHPCTEIVYLQWCMTLC